MSTILVTPPKIVTTLMKGPRAAPKLRCLCTSPQRPQSGAACCEVHPSGRHKQVSDNCPCLSILRASTLSFSLLSFIIGRVIRNSVTTASLGDRRLPRNVAVPTAVFFSYTRNNFVAEKNYLVKHFLRITRHRSTLITAALDNAAFYYYFDHLFYFGAPSICSRPETKPRN